MVGSHGIPAWVAHGIPGLVPMGSQGGPFGPCPKALGNHLPLGTHWPLDPYIYTYIYIYIRVHSRMFYVVVRTIYENSENRESKNAYKMSYFKCLLSFGVCLVMLMDR